MVSYHFFNFGALPLKLPQIVLINDNNILRKKISEKLRIEHKRKKCKYTTSQVLSIRNGIFFNFGAVTSKLAHSVLINDRNNMCEGITQKLKIEHKQKKM